MKPNDMQPLMEYILDLLGEIATAIGGVFTSSAADTAAMSTLTVGIFGEQGGLIYWCNQKLLWLMEQILDGLAFTSPLGP